MSAGILERANPRDSQPTTEQPFPKPPPREIGKKNTQDFSGCTDICHAPTVSGTPLTLDELSERLKNYLLLEDDDVVVVLLGTVAAFLLGGDPVWLLVVAPPSRAKTELLKLLKFLPEVRWLSALTPKTLASGYQNSTSASLLNELDKKILAFKDLTTVLTMRWDDQREILSQLREIYDGQFSKAFGTGQKLDWKGRLGFVAGVTTAIDKHHSVMGLLGPRFVFIRLQQPDRLASAKRAIQNSLSQGDTEWSAVAKDVAGFMAGLPLTRPSMPSRRVDDLATMASFVTTVRSPVERNSKTRELEHAPEPEMPGRFGRQLSALACGVAVVSGHDEVCDDDLRRVARVARDCIPPLRRAVFEALMSNRGNWTTAQVHELCSNSSKTAVRRTLEDLNILGVVDRRDKEDGLETYWSLNRTWRLPAELCFGTVVSGGKGR